MAKIIIKSGREKSLLHRHPWIFSGAIQRVEGIVRPGETVDVLSGNGQFLAKAAYNPLSGISGRVWEWDESIEISPDFFEKRIKQAIELRESLHDLFDTNAVRLVHGESDGIPGLILDQYNDVAVVQYLTAGTEYWHEDLNEIIESIIRCKVLYERSDVEARKLEGLEDRNGLIYGKDFQNPITICEGNVNYLVDVVDGHKTGFYLDQRDNRIFTREITSGKKVLDCFSYTGGFAINACLGGAKSITLVDSSSFALDYAKRNFSFNQLDLQHIEFADQDVFKYLRFLRDKGERYDLIILDPPKFAPTISQAERAARGYKDINLLALKLLDQNGLLLSFSCSGGISEEFLQKIIAGAADDAGVKAVILKRLHQAADHPVALNFPEGAYLKGFLIQRLD